MKVNSYNVEFGYEILSAVPYAYELYLRGELTETESGADTESLYYFSPRHKSNTVKRVWPNINMARRAGLPYTFIHQPEQPAKKFPPYKEYYANTEYKFEKPTLCICNRKNKEWGVDAINYFDADILNWLFSHLKDKYEIVYFPVAIPEEFQDSAHSEYLNDEDIARAHGVRLFTDLRAGKSWNETMLKVFANCEHYITMNGGYSILASLFSGTNIIFSKPGEIETREIKNGSFWRWYPNMNNVRTLHVPDYEALKIKVKSLYINEDPCFNILIRTHRANYLKRCMASIDQQQYENINVVLICDSDQAVQYTRGYNARMVHIKPFTEVKPRKQNENYGKSFPYNKYLDIAQRMVSGYLIMLDDDDHFTDVQALKKIAGVVDPSKLVVWRVNFNEQGIKPSFSFGKSITLYDITGIGFCYHTDQVKHTDWSEWKRADFRTAKKLSRALSVHWLDEVLTGLQDSPGAGIKQDLSSSATTVRVRMTYPGGASREQYFTSKELELYKPHFKNQGICIEQLT